MNEPRSRRGRAVAAVAAGVLSAAAVAACGADGGGAAKARSQQAKFEEAALKHAECMRRNGADVPDPKPGQRGLILRGPRSGGDTATFEKAVEACREVLEKVRPPELSEERKAEFRDAALAHARCMRRQGVDFPDPTFGAGGEARIRLRGAVDPNDPRLRAAERKCRGKLPGGGRDRGGPGGPIEAAP